METLSELSPRRITRRLVHACVLTLVLRSAFAQTLAANESSGLGFFLASETSSNKSDLQSQIQEIAKDARGNVSVACSLPGTSINCDLAPHAHPPMQSVFKLPLVIAVFHQVELGNLNLDQPVHFLPDDRIPHAYSPLQDKYPNAGVDLPLRELMQMTVSLSDNVAADILLRLVGGPSPVSG